jgi:hypothetical protein
MPPEPSSTKENPFRQNAGNVRYDKLPISPSRTKNEPPPSPKRPSHGSHRAGETRIETWLRLFLRSIGERNLTNRCALGLPGKAALRTLCAAR